MSEHRITVAGGSSVRLPTGGKYCDRDIIVTAEGGGTELPTLNNPAAETDVVKGKEYIDASGAKKTGTVEEVSGEFVVEDCVDFALDGASMVAVAMTPTGNGNLVRGETAVIVPFPADWTGSAAPEDVAAGKTFTSIYGVRVAGTRKPQTLPTLNNPASENDVALGKEYIGADGEMRYGQLHMDGVWTPDWSTYVPVHIGYDSDDRYLVMDNLDGVGGPSVVTKRVNFNYFTIDEGTPASEIRYFVGKKGTWNGWGMDDLYSIAWRTASDGETIELSSEELLIVECSGIGGFSYYCEIYGGCCGINTYAGYAYLMVNPDSADDITITSMYAP